MFGTLLRQTPLRGCARQLGCLLRAFGSRGTIVRNKEAKEPGILATKKEGLASRGMGKDSSYTVEGQKSSHEELQGVRQVGHLNTAVKQELAASVAQDKFEQDEIESDQDENLDEENIPSEIKDRYQPEAYEYDEDGAPIKQTPSVAKRIEISKPIKTELENPKIKQLVEGFNMMFGNALNFDTLYLENTTRLGVEQQGDSGDLLVKEVATKINMPVLLEKLLGQDLEKVIAFMCYRKEFITELELPFSGQIQQIDCQSIELHYCIPILSQDQLFPAFIGDNPEFAGLLTDQLSQVNVSSYDSGTVLFREVSRLFGYTTPPEVVVNMLRNQTGHFTRHLFFPKDNPSYLPAIEELVKQGNLPLPEQVAKLNPFLEDLFKHLADPALRKNNILTMSSELEGFFHHLFYSVRLFSLEQALKLLELFYQTVVLTAPAPNNITLDENQDTQDFTLLGDDRIANLPILEALDLYLSENILQLSRTFFCVR